MKAHYNIIQGSEEWHEIKHGRIGGTLAGGLFVNSDTLLIEILSKKLEDYYPDFDQYISADMERGNLMEPVAKQQLESFLGIKIKSVGWLQSDIDLLGISPDGINEDETICFEIKCPGAKKHTATILSGEIPKDNIDQCLHYFTVNDKIEKLYFCSYRPENRLKPLFITSLNRSSLIDLGTKLKPIIKPISEWVILARSSAEILQKRIDSEIEKLEF